MRLLNSSCPCLGFYLMISYFANLFDYRCCFRIGQDCREYRAWVFRSQNESRGRCCTLNVLPVDTLCTIQPQ